jgi:hypothetical protein
MVTVDKIKSDLIPRLAELTVMNQLVTTVFVDSNPAIVNYIEIQKEGTLIKRVSKSKQYKLKKHQVILKIDKKNLMIISDEITPETIKDNVTLLECLSMRINRNFMDIIGDMDKIETKKWSFFNRNFISKLFIKRTKNQLIHKILEFGSDSNYIIVPSSVAKIITKSNFFESNGQNCNSLIKNIGNLRIDSLCLGVYMDSQLVENKVYFARYNSVLLVLNKNLEVKEVRSVADKKTITVSVDYEFIQQDVIKCLCL